MKIANRLAGACLLSALTLLAVPGALAHEFIVKPAQDMDDTTTVEATLMVTEVYMTPDRLPPEATILHVVTEEGQTPVDLSVNEDHQTMDAVFNAPEGPYMLVGQSERTRPVKPPRGAPEPAEGTPTPMLRMQAFSKALVDPKGSGVYAQTPLGLRLELVPQQALDTVTAGDTVRFNVLFDGAPVSARVQATYDGHTTEEHGYVVRTESDETGVTEVTFSEPGLWIVRTKVVREEAGDGYDQYEGASNIIIPVAPAEGE